MDKRTEIISLRLDQISNGYLLNQQSMLKLNDEIESDHIVQVYLIHYFLALYKILCLVL